MKLSAAAVLVFSCFLLFFVWSAHALSREGDFVKTPFGVRHKDCVRDVPNHALIEENELGEVWVTDESGVKSKLENLGLCSSRSSSVVHRSVRQFPADYDGWLAYTTAYNQAGFDTFLGYFTVPNKPKSDPQVLYLFTGLQNVDWIPKVDPEPKTFDIIQPVLQYPSEEGIGWSVRSWYVTLTNDVLVSPEALCDVGDNIFGNMTQTAPDTWFIGSTTNDGQGKTVSLTVNRPVLKTQPWAYVTLECYGCSDCDYEPTNNSNFTQMYLSLEGNQITPSWTASTSPNPKCHEAAHIVDPTNVFITFSDQ